MYLIKNVNKEIRILPNSQFENDLRIQEVNLSEFQRLKTISRISAQVAHDIQSPLSVLNIALENIHSKNEQSIKLLKLATARIQLIVGDLGAVNLRNYKVNICEALNEVLYLKTIEYPKAKIKFELKGRVKQLNALLNQSDFSRIISNMINNSIESAKNKIPEIRLILSANKSNIIVDLIDNGTSIPKELRTQVFKKGISFNKPQGKGLGLSFSYEKIRSWQGDIKILASKKDGTTFRIIIPKLN